MKAAALVFGVAVLCPAFASAQHDHAPYAGLQEREIKALSAEEVEGYLDGAGMSMALSGELNGYPGPRHVLELAEQLELSEEQVAAVQGIYDLMHRRAVLHGNLIVERAVLHGNLIVELERRLDQWFAERSITPERLSIFTGQIAQLQGELRAVHLTAHLETAEVLSQHQRHTYDRLRGYSEH